MGKTFSDSLHELRANSVRVLGADGYSEVGKATAELLFSEGARARVDYWRVIKQGKERLSSFDHEQQYGLPAPIDAISELQKELADKTLTDAELDEQTGDLLSQFSEDIKLQVFAFSGYEVSEISFPDGTGQYSNQAK
jgi:hypothetical protein